MSTLLFTLLALAGLLRAVHDAQTFSPGCLARLGNWFDNRESWRNKYKNRDTMQGPAFWLAETWLVGFTDAWHASNLVAWLCADMAFLVAAWPAYRWWAVGAVVARRVLFEPVYGWLRKLAP